LDRQPQVYKINLRALRVLLCDFEKVQKIEATGRRVCPKPAVWRKSEDQREIIGHMNYVWYVVFRY